MASLKEQTAELHREAESQPFIKSIFENAVDTKKYTAYLFQLAAIYHVLEEVLGKEFKLFEGMEDLKRAPSIMNDFNELNIANDHSNMMQHNINQSTLDYMKHLLNIDNANDAMAHVYVRHMGDLFGGQSLAKLVPGSATMYKFDNLKELIGKVREHISEDMGEEAKIAFQHNINMIKDYN